MWFNHEFNPNHNLLTKSVVFVPKPSQVFDPQHNQSLKVSQLELGIHGSCYDKESLLHQSKMLLCIVQYDIQYQELDTC